MPSFSLKWFLVGVAFVGLLMATFVRPWAWLNFTTAAVVWSSIVVAAIAAVTSVPGCRFFARGYAIATLAYLFAAMGQWQTNPFDAIPFTIDRHLVSPLYHELMPILVTRFVEPGETVKETSPGYYEIQMAGVTRSAYSKDGGDRGNTKVTIHLALAVLIGCVGGCLAMMMRAKSHGNDGLLAGASGK